ncbi:MarR family winged helix-turn-helix transcriptional regulator [Microbacterium marinilacus]|nr:MarR family transcriptional regulator [Microbacterium marinilacus]MBY0689192.1 MarR family transcriptional regulator [Microbacterium marinilacus]
MPNTGASAALDPMLCFAVYSLDRRIGRIYRDLLAPVNLSYTQYIVLRALWGNDGMPLTVSELGEVLDLDSGTLSPLLARLESRGLIRRARGGGGDERIVRVALTDDGAELEAKVGDVQQLLCERIPADPADVADLLGRLRAVSDAIATARG